MPGYIREQLTCLIGDSLLANPNEYCNLGCVISGPGEIRRQLMFFAQNKEVAIILYRHGGFVTRTLMIFMNFKETTLIDLWSGLGDQNLTTVKSVLKYIEENRNKHGNLHPDHQDY